VILDCSHREILIEHYSRNYLPTSLVFSLVVGIP
jgi:hypothetical protein